MQNSDIGLIGLAVMGQNLVLNMNDHGYKVSVYNRTSLKTEDFIKTNAKNSNLKGTFSIKELVDSLKHPRKIMLMVKAGQAVDMIIEQLLPHLSDGDIIIDGGNSLFSDSNRRMEYLKKKSIGFLGIGISGGEEGARTGPSIMPGGDFDSWKQVQELFKSISAKIGSESCCDWVGENGAGHYVKMVHNGIEYGDMQQISEAYSLMKNGLGMKSQEIKEVFQDWNKTELDSYLIEITADILGVKDENGDPLIDKILDAAGQKGTGKWTGINALELGIPLTLIGEAVFARCLSSFKEERTKASKIYSSPPITDKTKKEEILKSIKDALYASKIISYAQGFMLLREAAKIYNWKLNYSGIAMMWRGGCIIRSVFLGEIKKAYDNNPELENLLLSNFFTEEIKKAVPGWRKALIFGIENGIAMPALTSALEYFDGYRTEHSSANMIQAQRDYFGAHTYERTDKPRGEFFHTDWLTLSKS